MKRNVEHFLLFQCFSDQLIKKKGSFIAYDTLVHQLNVGFDSNKFT